MSPHPETLSLMTTTTTLVVAVACVAAASLVSPPPSSGKRLHAVCFSTSGGVHVDLPARGQLTVVASADPFVSTTIAALAKLEHVDGAFLGAETDNALTVYVLAKEHGLVDREMLLDLEDELSAFRGMPVVLTVRAHQGRELRTLSGADLLFARG